MVSYAGVEGFRCDKFADGSTSSNSYDHQFHLDDVVADLRKCQARTHEWGVRNRVSFDPNKEHFKVIHHMDGAGV